MSSRKVGNIKMKAENKNIVCKNRTPLEKVIPLDTPFTIAIDPCNLCNFKCKFCAMQTVEKKQNYTKQMMSIELFKKIIDDLTQFPQKVKSIRINGQGEPFLNKNFCEMVRYAKEKAVAEWLETITNGSMLNPELNQQIADSGINRVRISVESISEVGYKDMAQVNIDLPQFINNIRDLYDKTRGKVEIYIKTVDAAVPTQKEKEKFYNLFGDICDQIFIDNVIPLWSDFDEMKDSFDFENQVGMHGQKLKKIQICPFPFYSFIINPEGEVTACCADWQRKLVLGNVAEESLLSIWNGKKYRKFLIDLLKGKKNCYEMCAKCLLPIYDCNDDIDEYADMILERINIK